MERDSECDLILKNGNFITLDERQPRAEAVAIRGEWLVFVGDSTGAMRLKGRHTQVVDLRGLTVTPGFNDAHNHMLEFGLNLRQVSLKGLTSIDRIKEAIARKVRTTPPGTLVRAWGYNHGLLAEGRHLTRWDLDEVSPDHPVQVSHVSGHMNVVNSLVLAGSGVTAATADPPGGTIVRRGDGEPTGLLQESAKALVAAVVPDWTLAELRTALEGAAAVYLSEGITSSQEGGIGFTGPIDIAAYQAARDGGRFPIRASLDLFHDELPVIDRLPAGAPLRGLGQGLRSGFGDRWLRLGPLKFRTDGSLVGRTAAVSRPYEGTSDERGQLLVDPVDYPRQVRAAHEAGWQICVHAVGDVGVDTAVAAFEEALAAAPLAASPRAGCRHRIEHCGVISGETMARIARAGIVLVGQPAFLYELGPVLRRSFGAERVKQTLRLRSILDAGIPLAGASDRPVVDGRPLLGIHAAVNEMSVDGAPWVPEEAITPEEALRMYTVGSAYASFEEGIKGAIRPGLLADLAVLSDDPTSIKPSRIKDIAVVATMVGGRCRFGEENLTAG